MLCRAAAWNLAGLESGSAGPAETAWINEMATCYRSLVEANSRCLALTAHARLNSVKCFFEVMERVLVLVQSTLAETADGFSARLAWMEEHVQEHGAGGSAERCIVSSSLQASSPAAAAVIDIMNEPFSGEPAPTATSV